MDQTYTLSGMHCANCTAKVTAALKPFAENVAVTLDPPRVVLQNAKPANLSELQAAVSKAGAYELSAAAPVSSVAEAAAGDAPPSWLATYQPLVVIAAYIAIAAFAGTNTGPAGAIDWRAWMVHFMAGFFLVFSAFKFLDLKGFADAYSTYDLLAQRWHGYGYIYPFLELGLGLAYLFSVAPLATNAATLVLMGFSSLGVLSALRNKRQIQCACLGTVLKLPMSTITLIEDLGMAAMAAVMLLAGGHN
jgi:copper chaperone CopZ